MPCKKKNKTSCLDLPSTCLWAEGKIRQYCRKRAQKRSPPSKECPPHKIRNPRTGRCVLKCGKIGKQILKERPGEERPGGRTTNTNCPSKNINPRTLSCYRKNSLLLHPDKNFGCVAEATKKIKVWNSKCGR